MFGAIALFTELPLVFLYETMTALRKYGGGDVKVGLWSLVKAFEDGGCMNRWKTAINAIYFTSSGSSHLRLVGELWKPCWKMYLFHLLIVQNYTIQVTDLMVLFDSAPWTAAPIFFVQLQLTLRIC